MNTVDSSWLHLYLPYNPFSLSKDLATPRVTRFRRHTARGISSAYAWKNQYLIAVGSNKAIRRFTLAWVGEPVTINDVLGRNMAVGDLV